MRLHRFYVSQKIGTQTALTVDSPELANQIRNVFRLKTGDKVILFDGSGNDYDCVLDGFGDESKIKSDSTIRLQVATTMRSAFLAAGEVILCAAIIKKDTFEWIVEKATELGASEIIPVVAERSEKKGLNIERLKKIAIEASEQSGRGDVPTIYPIMTLKEAVEWAKEKKISAIALHTDIEVAPRGQTSLGRTYKKPLQIFIGPEGGWSPDEITLFHKDGIPLVNLGPQVLRTETAVVSALSILLLGEL